MLAIVPARGGSRGLVGKNMRHIAGRPLIEYTVEAVAASSYVERLLVSSDDPAILHWARIHGFEAAERPGDLAGPEATISEVAAHHADDLDWHGVVGVFQPT